MKTLTAWTSAAVIAVAALGATIPTASARSWHHRHHGYYHHHGYRHHGYYGGYYGGGAGFGIGLLSGAIIGGALAAPYYDYPPVYDYRYRYYRPYRTYRYVPAPAYRVYDRPRTYYRVGAPANAHVNWCYAHYRSYRAWDDTFQPYHGPRRACISPY
jgi:hypothetical protein